MLQARNVVKVGQLVMGLGSAVVPTRTWRRQGDTATAPARDRRPVSVPR